MNLDVSLFETCVSKSFPHKKNIVLLIPETLKVPGALRQAWPILGPVSGIGVGVGISILPTLLS